MRSHRGLRIGIDALSWDRRSGYGRYCRELVSALLTLPTQHSFTLLMDPYALAPAGAEVLRFEPAGKVNKSATRSVTDMLRLMRVIAWAPIDVWFFPSPQNYVPVLSKARVLTTLHDTIPWQFPSLTFANRVQLLAWRLKVALAIHRSADVITVSEHARESISKLLRVPDSALRIVSEAPAAVFKPDLDPAKVGLVAERLGIPAEARVIVYHGALAPHKDLGTLVNAFARLTGIPAFSDVNLVIVGSSDWVNLRGRERSLRTRCMNLKRVKLAGSLGDADLALLLNRATIAVLPSLDEGFGLTGLEAVACGLPLIATRSSALPNVLGDVAVYFTPRAGEELFGHLVDLLSDPARRQRMRERGLHRVATMSWKKEAMRLLSLFDELAAADSARQP
jgi:glycosyltransferase involved in cell wall biosynthesis